MDERRQHPRLPLRREVTVCLPDQERVTAVTVDVSHGGCRLRLPRRVPIGSPLVVELPAGGNQAMPTRGRVRHLVSQGDAVLAGVQWLV